MIKISLFSQIVQHLPKENFQKLVKKYATDKHSKGIDSWTHLVSMIFCHLGKINSVRDISHGLQSIAGNLNHLGIKKAPCKSSISYINKNRDSVLFKDFYFQLLDYFRSQHNFQRSCHKRLKRKIFILDSTTISLCLSLFDWATFRQRKGGIKLHTVLDYDGCLPVYMNVSQASKHDSTLAKEITFPQGSIVVVDRAYVDYAWFKQLDLRKIFFVTRAKENMDFEVVESFQVPEAEKDTVLEDQDITLRGHYTAQKYPGKLRRIRFYDKENNRELTFLTNNRSWTASTIASLYKSRWEIEVFFKQIKQHLKIKSFIGTSENAVLIQIWTALITMLLLQFLKAKATFKWHLSNLITFIRLNLLSKIKLYEWLNNPFWDPVEVDLNQLELNLK
jgi:hypothetical protein